MAGGDLSSIQRTEDPWKEGLQSYRSMMEEKSYGDVNGKQSPKAGVASGEKRTSM
jgi:hypothetical protein